MAHSMHDFVVAALAPLSQAEVEAVARETKISKWTVQKITLRQIENPGVKSVQVLYDHLKLRETRKRRAA